MYPTSVNRIAAIQERFRGRSFPVAEAIAERLLTLPTHGYVSSRDRSRIRDLLLGDAAAAAETGARSAGACQ
jgi:hypothetical protein